MATYDLPRPLLEETFNLLRECGRGRHECQILWVGPWDAPTIITEVVHPVHRAGMFGFELDDRWLTEFWLHLAQTNSGIRAQVHTHPEEAFHSRIDDDYPVIHSPGFLSLVIPNFALGPVGFGDAFLTEIQVDGHWQQVAISDRLRLT